MDTISALAMMNSGILLHNLKNEMPRHLKPKQMLANIYTGAHDFSQNNDEPMDLSRLCDSVETRTTSSPCNSSGYGDLSPNSLNDSSTLQTQSLRDYTTTIAHNISHVNRFQSDPFNQRLIKSESNDRTRFPFDQTYEQSLAEHRFMRGHSIASTDDEMDVNNLQAIALQRTLLNLPRVIVPAATATASSSTSSTSDPLSPIDYPMIMGEDGKMVRPFKAFPYDIMSVNDPKSNEQFNIFRQQILEDGQTNCRTNPNMRRMHDRDDNKSDTNEQTDSTSTNDTLNGKNIIKRDLAYFERRHKNNIAAKKSRDRRKQKEDEIAIRAAFLERENFQLKIELAAARRQLEARLGK